MESEVGTAGPEKILARLQAAKPEIVWPASADRLQGRMTIELVSEPSSAG